MSEDRLSQLLRGLPRERASEEFTPEVLRRIEVRPYASSFTGRIAAIAAILALLVLGGLIGDRIFEQRQDRARIETLRAEQQAIENELRHIRRASADLEPVVYLGSQDNVDLFLDLRKPGTSDDTLNRAYHRASMAHTKPTASLEEIQ